MTMKFAKGHSQKDVNAYVEGVRADLEKQDRCKCSISSSTYGDIYGRPICQNCGKPINSGAITITVPYWYYQQT